MVSYEDAKKLVDMGLSVIPLKEREKTPAIPSWEEYQHRLPTDMELHKWFDDGKNNIAIVCGEVSKNFITLDFDNKEIIPFVIEDIQNYIGKTYVVQTNRGYHLGFRLPINVDKKFIRSREFKNLGIDLRGEGGYIVAPPSIHPSGKPYQFKGELKIETIENYEEFFKTLEEKDQEAKYLWEILPYWYHGQRNNLIVGLTEFFKIKLNWKEDKIRFFLQGINRMKPVPEDVMSDIDIEHKVKQSFEKNYNYRKFIDNTLLTKLYKLLSEGTGYNINEDMKDLKTILQTGANAVFEYLIDKHTYKINGEEIKGIKTIADPDSDKEDIYIYKDRFYTRGETILKEEGEQFFRERLMQSEYLIKRIEIALHKQSYTNNEQTTEIDIEKTEEYLKKINNELEKMKETYEKLKNKAVITPYISEALFMIRRNTYVDRETLNPKTHIPFKNGYLNLETWELEPLNPELFYTWSINANYLNRPIDPKTDLPEFVKFLSTLVAPEHLPALLYYCAYALMYPSLPNHKILWLVGKERVGKGTLIRLLKLLNPKGFASISLAKILKGETYTRFDLAPYETKNFVSDMEITEKPITEKEKREKKIDFSLLNKIHGKDTVDLEEKFKSKRDGVLEIKGIYIQNLPMLPIDNKATRDRSIVIPTLDTVINNLITDLEEKIFEKEGDAIATYLANILKVLKEMNFQFPEIYRILGKGDIIVWKGLNADTKADLIDNLSDPVKFFIEEKTDIPEISEEEEEGIKHSSNTHEYPVNFIYSEFVKWCKGKGIAPLPKQTFTEKFSEFYPKKRKRVGGKLTYVFTNLILLDDSQVGTPKKIQKDMQDNNSEYMECLFQLMSNLLITPLIESNKGGILIINTKLEQGKKLFESNAGLISRYKSLCSNLFTLPENLDEEGGQGSSQGSSEGIPIEEFSKIEQESSEEKGEESIPDSQALKDYHYFKSEDYFSDRFFKDFGIQNVEHKEFEKMHYYKIPYSEISKDKYKEYSNKFAINSKVFVIDKTEFDSIEGKEEKEK
jgi:phage/plasmid-associated DNA primase